MSLGTIQAFRLRGEVCAPTEVSMSEKKPQVQKSMVPLRIKAVSSSERRCRVPGALGYEHGK
jgi:hypothetical protein